MIAYGRDELCLSCIWAGHYAGNLASRRVHAACFGALDRYYTPFVAPPRAGSTSGGRAARAVDSECNRGLNVILQLLTKDADKFVYAAGLLADMGYREVNFNLGCPSGTVFNKGRGSGLLHDPEAIDAFAYASARTRAW